MQARTSSALPVVIALAGVVLLLGIVPVPAGANSVHPALRPSVGPTILANVSLSGTLTSLTFNPVNDRLYALDLAAGDLLALNASSGALVRRIGGFAGAVSPCYDPCTLAVDPLNGTVYVPDGHRIAMVDVHDRVVGAIHTTFVAYTLTIDPVAEELFATVNRPWVAVFSLTTGQLVAQVPIVCTGPNGPHGTYVGAFTGTVYDPSTGWVDAASSWYSYSSLAGRTCVSAIDPALNNTILHTHASSYGASGAMAVAPGLDRVFFLNNLFGGGLGAVETINASSTRSVSLEYPWFAENWGWSTTALAMDGVAHALFVTDSNGSAGFLSALSPRTGNVTAFVAVGDDPVGVVVDARSGDLWVANGSPAVLTEVLP